MDGNAVASSSKLPTMTPSQEKAVEAAAVAQKVQDSRERYMAGQSVMKAGLTRDEREVNAIIMKASAGSKYHKNQMKRNDELEGKIVKLVALKDRIVKTANLELLEEQANVMLTELEAGRDLSQYIVHVDMDAFYANVEVKRDPSLKGKAFGVGGGVLTTASYEARKYGCRSGMAGHVAKALCPHLIFVPANFQLYGEASQSVREVLIKYDENLCMAGMDEGYLNITPYMSEHNMSASEVVSHLRAEVEDTTGLTISAGIAPNTMLAKICSDKNKPNGQFELPFEGAAIRSFMRTLPIRTIPGIGRVHERVLKSMSVDTCGDIFPQRAIINAMDKYLGLSSLLRAYLGIGNNVITPGKREERKSVGCERTFRDKSKDEEILATLEEIAKNLEGDLERTKFAGRTVTVKYKLHSYEVFTRAKTVGKAIKTAEEILPIARELLIRELPLRIRLLGIRMTNLHDLEAPEAGIKKFFNASPSKPKSSTKRGREDGPIDTDVEATSDADENEVQEQKQITGSMSPPPSSGRTSDGLLLCPICWQTLKRGSDNVALNQHIDMCLNAQVISDDSDDSDDGTPKQKAPVAASKPTVKKKQKQTKLPMAAQLKKPANAFDLMMGHSKKKKKKKK